METSKTTCETCGGVDYELKDGYFFCSVCQTQSQDIREEKVAEDEYVVFPQHKLAIHTRVQRKEKTTDELGQNPMWTTNDCFNVILKKMVDILISMGVSAQLKDVIKQLWFLYLKKTQYAFCISFGKSEWIPKLPVLPRERDVQVLNTSNPTILAKKYRQTFFRGMRNRIHAKKRKSAESLRSLVTSSKKRKKSEKTASDDPSALNLKDSKLQTSDLEDFALLLPNNNNDVITPNETIIQDSDSHLPTTPDRSRENRKKVYSKRQYSKEALKCKNKSLQIQQGSVARMSMSRVLEFLYLGLIMINEQILLCDLLRWIQESWLPLRQAAHLLPVKYDFQTYDTMTFRLLELPENKVIRSKTAKLAVFLDLDLRSIPKKSVQEIAARFILDLKLPSELHSLVHNLALTHPSQFLVNTDGNKRVFPIPNYEGRALAFIVVILKLLFGLDGISERKQDKYSRKLSQLLPDVKPFIWEDWKSYITSRQHLLQRNFIFECVEQPENCNDVDQVVGYYVEHEVRAKGKLSSRHAKTYRTSKEVIREGVRLPFKSVAKIPEVYPALGIQPTSFPYSSREKQLLAESTELQQCNHRILDFHKKTLRHLIHPERFRAEIEKNNASLEIKKSVWKSSSSRRKERKKAGKKKTSSKSKSSSGLSLCVYQPYYKYNLDHYKRNEHGIYNEKSSKFSSSLRWLMDILSNTGGMKAETLYEEVMLVERVLIRSNLRKQLHKYLVETMW